MILRGLYPGAHWPILPVLIGGGGLGKAMLLRAWVDDRAEWFTDADSLMAEKALDRQAALKSVWVAELPELAGLTKKDAADIKRLLAQDSDEARRLYAGDQAILPRGCVFAATANRAGGGARLPDLGDNGRRLAPVTLLGVPLPVGTKNRNPQTGFGIDIEGLRAERGQILAEALAFVRQMPRNEKTGFPDFVLPDALKDMRAAQAPLISEDPLREAVTTALVRALQAHAAIPPQTIHPLFFVRNVRGRPAVPSAELRAFTRDAWSNNNTQHAANMIGNIMTDLGCDRVTSNGAIYWQLPNDLLTRLTS